MDFSTDKPAGTEYMTVRQQTGELLWTLAWGPCIHCEEFALGIVMHSQNQFPGEANQWKKQQTACYKIRMLFECSRKITASICFGFFLTVWKAQGWQSNKKVSVWTKFAITRASASFSINILNILINTQKYLSHNSDPCT